MITAHHPQYQPHHQVPVSQELDLEITSACVHSLVTSDTVPLHAHAQAMQQMETPLLL